jgi:hypothetical protein
MFKYYCDSSIKSDVKWKSLLKRVIYECDSVEFNILDKNYQSTINNLLPGKNFIIKEKREGKIYSTGKYLSFVLDNSIIEFIFSMDYSEWHNFSMEDLCLVKNNIDILSTITHENYVILLMTEQQKEELNYNGFNFDVEWK